jgi:hypothetical protein
MHATNEPVGMAMAYGPGQERGKLAAIAEWQLEKWREHAREWPLHLIVIGDRQSLACGHCGVEGHIVWLADIHGQDYHWTFGQLESQLVLHLRNKHRDLEEKVYYG